MSKAETKKDAYVGFHATEAQREEIRERAKRDGRSVAGWMRRRLALLFEIDDKLTDDRRRNVRQALTSQT